MHNRFAALAALSALALLLSACGADAPAVPPLVVSSTPVAGYGGMTATPPPSAALALSTSVAVTPTAAPATQTPVPGPVYGESQVPTARALPTAPSQLLVIEIGVANNAQYGPILVDGKGRTLYLRTSDAPRVSTCSSVCAQAWPPAVPYGRKPSALAGIDPTKLNSIVRADGMRQVTYNDWPLYYYSGDTAPGQTNGQGIGGVWYAVTVSGDPAK